MTDDLKIDQVVPVYKSGDKDNFNNYQAAYFIFTHCGKRF